MMRSLADLLLEALGVYWYTSRTTGPVTGLPSGASVVPRTEPAVRSQADLQRLARLLDRQEMVLFALLVLMLEKGVCTRGDLDRVLMHVDGLDGVVDGRIGREAAGQTQCPACARTNAPGAARCLYCGAEIAASILDRRIVKPE